MSRRAAKKNTVPPRPRGGASCPCPECGQPTRVVDTRRKSGAVIVNRERECRECGHRFTTNERIAT